MGESVAEGRGTLAGCIDRWTMRAVEYDSYLLRPMRIEKGLTMIEEMGDLRG